MALTYSEMVPLGKSAPKFELVGIDGKTYSLESFKGKSALVVMFICVHCPYVKAVEERLARLARDFSAKGAQFVAINSNDVDKYPEDSPENMQAQAKAHGFEFPYLVDETQEVARAYDAVCTPDIFVFDRNQKLAYRGRIDDSWKDPAKVKRHDLRDALEAVLAGKPASTDQIPSMGCSIKWKSADQAQAN
ncbi:MAG: thioredoxin family protein [Deltaproteobacteria bacterium]|nr:thioredoxin family protein [Deltaproteobacteria bacterium]